MADRDIPSSFYNPHAFVFDPEVVIALMADARIRQATERGDFDNLPGAGKPLDLTLYDDPDWWLKNLLRREGFRPPLPPSIQLRKDDAALDGELDRMFSRTEVRREVEGFNERVIRARYELPSGPPLITMPRDVEATVEAWAERKAARLEEARAREREERDRREEELRRRRSARRRRLWFGRR